MADPAAALGETRRVLRSEGRVALAVWDRFDRNPWALLPAEELLERGLISPEPGKPGPFTLGDEERVRELLEQAGFADVRVEALELHRRHASFAEYWESTLDLSRSMHDAVMSAPAAAIPEIEAAVQARFAPYEAQDGRLDIPARTLVACASA
jgi:SAM-dependent methyltransferase